MADIRSATEAAQAGEQEASLIPDDYDFAFGQAAQWDYEGQESVVSPPRQTDVSGRVEDRWGTTFSSTRSGSSPGASFGSTFDDLVQMAQGGGRTGDIEYTGSIKPTGGKTAGSGLKQPYANITTKATVLPKGAQWPTFQGPKWDEQAIKAKARKLTAPVTAELGAKVQQAMSRYYENPNVRRMVLRDTLQGYGIGLGRAIAQGQTAATQEYNAEYGRQYNEAMNAYNMALSKLMSEATQVTTSRGVYSAQEFEKATGQKASTIGGTSRDLTSKRADMYGRTYV